jgi:hypothetical protein
MVSRCSIRRVRLRKLNTCRSCSRNIRHPPSPTPILRNLPLGLQGSKEIDSIAVLWAGVVDDFKSRPRHPSFHLPAHRINFFHYQHSPLNACVNQLVRPWASLWSPEQVISGLHVQARKNRSHDSDHPFAAFVHGGKWYTFRLVFAKRYTVRNRRSI